MEQYQKDITLQNLPTFQFCVSNAFQSFDFCVGKIIFHYLGLAASRGHVLSKTKCWKTTGVAGHKIWADSVLSDGFSHTHQLSWKKRDIPFFSHERMVAKMAAVISHNFGPDSCPQENAFGGQRSYVGHVTCVGVWSWKMASQFVDTLYWMVWFALFHGWFAPIWSNESFRSMYMV